MRVLCLGMGKSNFVTFAFVTLLAFKEDKASPPLPASAKEREAKGSPPPLKRTNFLLEL